ncbi:MAG: hypothetical protein K6G56_04760 [Clostridiales bacterium]|nr:hypothetical protein [Clostridiales bacterium]
MQKTRMGISVGLLGAMLFFAALFGGYVAAILLAGYVLLFEENAWLKKSAVKSVALLVCFSILTALLGLIPSLIGFIDSICYVFGGGFSISIISKILNVITSALSIIRTVLFLLLGFKALNQSSINVPVVDDLINKYMAE